eukprot:2377770-Rhodomonas_salina.5
MSTSTLDTQSLATLPQVSIADTMGPSCPNAPRASILCTARSTLSPTALPNVTENALLATGEIDVLAGAAKVNRHPLPELSSQQSEKTARPPIVGADVMPCSVALMAALAGSTSSLAIAACKTHASTTFRPKRSWTATAHACDERAPAITTPV